jgi:hypothetical protein
MPFKKIYILESPEIFQEIKLRPMSHFPFVTLNFRNAFSYVQRIQIDNM